MLFELEDSFHHFGSVPKESSFLIPLPETPFISTKEIFREVTSACLISGDGNRYSVPWPHAGKHVWIRVSQGRYLIIIYYKDVGILWHFITHSKKDVQVQ